MKLIRITRPLTQRKPSIAPVDYGGFYCLHNHWNWRYILVNIDTKEKFENVLVQKLCIVLISVQWKCLFDALWPALHGYLQIRSSSLWTQPPSIDSPSFNENTIQQAGITLISIGHTFIDKHRKIKPIGIVYYVGCPILLITFLIWTWNQTLSITTEQFFYAWSEQE